MRSATLNRIALDVAANGAGTHVLGNAETSSNPEGTLAIDTVVAAGTVEDNAVTPLVAAIPLSAKREIAFVVLASGKGTVSIYHVRVVASDTVSVPTGHFETWRLELNTGASVVVMQVARAAPCRIVRVQPNGAPFDIQLAK